MKKILLYIGIAIAAIGCATDDTVDITPETNAVQFSTPNIITRVTSAGAWEGTEVVGISMSGDAEATNVQYKAKSSGTQTTFEVATAGNEILYPRTGEVCFRAYYPYYAGITNTYTLSDISDQSKGIEQFDLLNAINSTKYSEGSGAVSFTFLHTLSKISIAVGVNGDLKSLEELSVKLNNVVVKNIKYDLTDADGNITYGDTGTITLYTTVASGSATATAEAIVVPGVDIEGATVTFSVKEGGRTFEADFELKNIVASTVYNYEIELGAIEPTFGAPTITEWKTSKTSTPDATDAEALGEGTAADPFLIYDETDMCAVGKGAYTKNSIYKGNWSLSSHYKLMNDVELTKAWSAIGTYTSDDTTTSFTGSFDGNNKSVKGISIDVEDSYQGLFGSISGATIKDLSVAGGVKSTVSLIGGIVGYAGTSTISNCSSSVVVEGYMSIGGIVGKAAEGCTVINCSNSGQVTSSTSSGYAYCGGVVGNSYDGNYIINCYNSATVISTVGYVGGVVGYTYSSTITNCYSSGLISTTAIANIGGVVGCNGSSAITLCYYDKEIDSAVGGAIAGADTTDAYGLTTSYMKSSSFLTLLNNGAYELTYSSVEACAWYTGASGYPEFDPSGAAPDTKEYDIAYDDGDDVYLIYTDKGMKAFADLVNNNFNSSDAYCLLKSGASFSSDANLSINGKLVNDIDISVVSGSSWTPIGGSIYIYAGKFDGDNRLISGLYINASSAYQGLFGYISDAEIKNLGVSGSVTNTGDNQYTAGVVGRSVNSTISDCYNLCKVAGSYYYVGGVVGYNNSSSETPSIVVNCYNLGDVSSTNNYLGGVVGGNEGNASVVNCYNQGDVSSSSERVGGVVGYNSSNNGSYGSVINCYNSGAVGSSSSSISSIGGVVGYNNLSCTVTNCYWDGETSAAGTMTTKATKAVGQEYNANNTATEMTTTAMQAGSFVTSLNNNAVSYNTSSPSITAHGWEVVEGSYPIFSGTTPTSTVPDIELVDGVYLIHTAAGLVAFSDIVNGVVNTSVNAGAGVTFSGTPEPDVCGTMTNSIDMSGETWSGIGSSEDDAYAGVFNGGSYTVTGLSAECGLVNYNSGTIINVGVSGVISGSDVILGGVVANNLSAGKVINCYNSASVTGTSGSVGGVVGENYGVVNNCYSYGAVSSSGESKGGVVGYNGNSGVISYCYYDTDENVDVSLVGQDDNNSNTTNSSGKTTEELQSETMLKILNNGAYYYNVAIQDGEPTACAWHTGPDKYPTFDHSATPTESIDIELKTEVYYIYTAEGLQAFADLTNGEVNTVAVTKGGIEFSSSSKLGSISGELTTSINLDNREWTPICKTAFYTGVFDGNGFEISGLNSDTGLFGYNVSGIIKNVIVSGLVSGSSDTGGILAYNNGGLVINCCSNVTISGGDSSSNGGIVGYNNDGSVVNCYNLGAVGGLGTNGGVVGYNSENGKVLNCYNSGAVSGGNTNGGVVGSNNGGTVTNGYFDNIVNSTLDAIGDDTVTTSITVSMTTTAMKNESFVKMLNNGAYDYNNDGNPDTKACKWVYTSGSYPTFDYSDINPTYTTPDISLVSGVYEINTAVGLNAFGYLVNGAVLNNAVTSGGVNFSTTAKTGIDGELTGDIDLSTICSAELNANWSPIGNAYNNYNGEFDGNGYEVKNIYINVAGAKRGLFGWTNTGAVIRDVGVSGTIVASNTSGSISYECGGVVAYNQGMIINCYNLANVTGDINVGGVAGYNCESGNVINCYNRGDVTGSGTLANKNIGGMVGHNLGEVLYGYSDGTVTGGDYVGGVVGYNVGDATISGCYYLEGSSTYCIGSSDYTGNSVAVSDDNGYYCSSSTKLQTLLSGYATTYNADTPTYTAHSWKDVVGQPYPIIDYQN